MREKADNLARDKGAQPSRDGKAVSAAEPEKKTPRAVDPPAAGPHAASELSNADPTPGAGALQTPGAKDDMDSTG